MLDFGVESLVIRFMHVLQSIGERVNVWLDRRSRIKQEAGTIQKEETVLKEEEANQDLQHEDNATRLGLMSKNTVLRNLTLSLR